MCSFPSRSSTPHKLSSSPASTPSSFYRRYPSLTHVPCEDPPHVSSLIQTLLILWSPHVLHAPLPMSRSLFVALPSGLLMGSHVLHCHIALPSIFFPQWTRWRAPYCISSLSVLKGLAQHKVWKLYCCIERFLSWESNETSIKSTLYRAWYPVKCSENYGIIVSIEDYNREPSECA